MKKQDAGRKILGNLAPQFAELNDDVMENVRDAADACPTGAIEEE